MPHNRWIQLNLSPLCFFSFDKVLKQFRAVERPGQTLQHSRFALTFWFCVAWVPLIFKYICAFPLRGFQLGFITALCLVCCPDEYLTTPSNQISLALHWQSRHCTEGCWRHSDRILHLPVTLRHSYGKIPIKILAIYIHRSVRFRL